jgi:hypothetical protein
MPINHSLFKLAQRDAAHLMEIEGPPNANLPSAPLGRPRPPSRQDVQYDE